MQFTAKKLVNLPPNPTPWAYGCWVGKYEFFVQSWTFHAIPRKKISELAQFYTLIGVGVVKNYFPVQSGKFHAIPSKEFLQGG